MLGKSGVLGHNKEQLLLGSRSDETRTTKTEIDLTEMACSYDNEERVLNCEEWRVEAQAVIYDVQDHVKEILIAEELGCGDQHIYLNLTTKELKKYCVELTAQGFRIVGYDYNSTDTQSDDYYETPYSLLNCISPLYREAFGNSLASKLLELRNERLKNRRPSEAE